MASTSIGTAELSDLIGRIHETVDCPSGWPTVLEAIAGALKAKSGLLRTLDVSGSRAVIASHHHNLDDELQADYCDGLVANDPYIEALNRLPAGRMVRNDSLVDLEQFRHTHFYRNYLAHLDNHFIVGGFVQHDGMGGRAIVGFHRHRRSERFSDDELKAVGLLAPHIRRAIRLGGLLRATRDRADSAEACLGALAVASFHLDDQGQVLHANGRGERMLRGAEGLRFRRRRLTTADPRHAEAFVDLIERTRAALAGRRPAAPTTLLVPGRAGEAPNLLVIARPLPRGQSGSPLGDRGPRIALYVGDLDDTGMLRADVLQAIYRLTSAEARLAVALARGRELGELADDWSVATETLRKQLKSVFAKTGMRRQTELVRQLAGAPWKLTDLDDAPEAN